MGRPALLHPSGPRAAEHGCWSTTPVSGEASGLSGFPTGALPAAVLSLGWLSHSPATCVGSHLGPCLAAVSPVSCGS